MKTLTEMLTEREAIAQLCETILDEGTEHWGVKVSSSDKVKKSFIYSFIFSKFLKHLWKFY